MDFTGYDVVIASTRIPEFPVEGKPLGRHIRHDSRSLFYLAPESDAAITDARVHVRTVPIFDQGNLGSCTGNASVGGVATSGIVEALAGFTHPTLDEALAVNVYSQATVVDGYPGQYPPTDTGSDGLAVATVLKNLGYLSGYTHATSRQAALTALLTVPVWIGINWYSGFDNPDASGHVTLSGSVRGGHEICMVGYNATDATVSLVPMDGVSVDVPAQCFLIANSWGSGWANQGFFTLSFADYDRLMSEQGDCTVPVPLTAPAPTPVPPTPPVPPVPPTPADADGTLAAVLHPWVARFPHFDKRIKNAARDWLAAKGL